MREKSFKSSNIRCSPQAVGIKDKRAGKKDEPMLKIQHKNNLGGKPITNTPPTYDAE